MGSDYSTGSGVLANDKTVIAPIALNVNISDQQNVNFELEA